MRFSAQSIEKRLLFQLDIEAEFWIVIGAIQQFSQEARLGMLQPTRG